MRGIDTQVRKIRRAIFREVANMAYNSKNLAEDMEALPYKHRIGIIYIESVKSSENVPDWQWECHFVQKMNQSLSVRV